APSEGATSWVPESAAMYPLVSYAVPTRLFHPRTLRPGPCHQDRLRYERAGTTKESPPLSGWPAGGWRSARAPRQLPFAARLRAAATAHPAVPSKTSMSVQREKDH